MSEEFVAVKTFIEEFQDYLAPRLDTYEQAIYLYLVRHSRLHGQREVTVGFKSARRKIAFGLGVDGTAMSEKSCYKKVKSLEAKGCVKVVGVQRDGTRVVVLLPSEIHGIRPNGAPTAAQDLDDMDFFNVPENRLAILLREGNRCFYCARDLDTASYVMEHLVSRPSGRQQLSQCRCFVHNVQ